MKRGERQLADYTDDQLVKLTGASKTNGRRAAKASADERKSLVSGKRRIRDLKAAVGPIDSAKADLIDQLNLMFDTPTAKPRLTVADFLAAYRGEWSPDERLAAARFIGVDRCWQPKRQRSS
jgi:hypothetical protein